MKTVSITYLRETYSWEHSYLVHWSGIRLNVTKNRQTCERSDRDMALNDTYIYMYIKFLYANEWIPRTWNLTIDYYRQQVKSSCSVLVKQDETNSNFTFRGLVKFISNHHFSHTCTIKIVSQCEISVPLMLLAFHFLLLVSYCRRPSVSSASALSMSCCHEPQSGNWATCMKHIMYMHFTHLTWSFLNIFHIEKL